MNDAPPLPASGPGTVLGTVRGVIVAMLVAIAVNLGAIAAGPDPIGGVSARLLHYLYEAGHILALGLVAAICVWTWERFGPRRDWAGYAALALVATAIGIPTLGEDLAGFSEAHLPAAPIVLRGGIIVGFGGVVAATAWLGNRLDRPRLRWVGIAAGTAGLVVNHLILRDDYPAAHLFLALAAATGIAASLPKAPIPRWWTRAHNRLPIAIGFALAATSIFVRPDNRVMLQMLRHSGSIVAPYQARVAFGGEEAMGVVPKAWEPWFAQRDDVAPIPATKPAWREKPLVVLLVTIDSLRADVLTDGKSDGKLKNLAKLRKDSVVFTEARAPGSQTVYTLSEMFASKYYSQMYWTKQEGIRDMWPHSDESVRFPELLQKAGVKTMSAAGTYWLVNEHGIVRGFDIEEYEKPKGTRYQVSAYQIPKVIEHLQALGPDEEFFGFAHLLDAHYTVSPVKRKGAYKKYIANLKLIDKELGELRKYLENNEIGERTVLIVSSDHGEAFGEHGTKRHRVSLYDELLRVPLWVWHPGIKPRQIETPVSLIDIGPTVLDAFGQPTPGDYFGQSLVPLLRGDKKAAKQLTRPILAEGRMKKALLFSDGMKAIVDDRNYTVELYNLKTDPKELNNLVLDATAPGMARIGILRQFFEKAQIQREGYEIPFRP